MHTDDNDPQLALFLFRLITRTRCDDATALAALVTDAMLVADHLGIAWAPVLERAQASYAAERGV